MFFILETFNKIKQIFKYFIFVFLVLFFVNSQFVIADDEVESQESHNQDFEIPITIAERFQLILTDNRHPSNLSSKQILNLIESINGRYSYASNSDYLDQISNSHASDDYITNEISLMEHHLELSRLLLVSEFSENFSIDGLDDEDKRLKLHLLLKALTPNKAWAIFEPASFESEQKYKQALGDYLGTFNTMWQLHQSTFIALTNQYPLVITSELTVPLSYYPNFYGKQPENYMIEEKTKANTAIQSAAFYSNFYSELLKLQLVNLAQLVDQNPPDISTSRNHGVANFYGYQKLLTTEQMIIDRELKLLLFTDFQKIYLNSNFTDQLDIINKHAFKTVDTEDLTRYETYRKDLIDLFTDISFLNDIKVLLNYKNEVRERLYGFFQEHKLPADVFYALFKFSLSYLDSEIEHEDVNNIFSDFMKIKEFPIFFLLAPQGYIVDHQVFSRFIDDWGNHIESLKEDYYSDQILSYDQIKDVNRYFSELLAGFPYYDYNYADTLANLAYIQTSGDLTQISYDEDSEVSFDNSILKNHIQSLASIYFVYLKKYMTDFLNENESQVIAVHNFEKLLNLTNIDFNYLSIDGEAARKGLFIGFQEYYYGQYASQLFKTEIFKIFSETSMIQSLVKTALFDFSIDIDSTGEDKNNLNAYTKVAKLLYFFESSLSGEGSKFFGFPELNKTLRTTLLAEIEKQVKALSLPFSERLRLMHFIWLVFHNLTVEGSTSNSDDDSGFSEYTRERIHKNFEDSRHPFDYDDLGQAVIVSIPYFNSLLSDSSPNELYDIVSTVGQTNIYSLLDFVQYEFVQDQKNISVLQKLLLSTKLYNRQNLKDLDKENALNRVNLFFGNFDIKLSEHSELNALVNDYIGSIFADSIALPDFSTSKSNRCNLSF